ncbi:MAG: NAD(P)(+) transhydrogenase (Re/Si-specific) subunit beta [Chloroflexia bacterium]|nr:NAD(P)(+) transhydrogenase (Re/Si-specific) subunit beta [Chloroflexia bacterium]
MFDNWHDAFIDLSYLIASICFILGLKMLSNPATARRGNQVAAAGMALAVIATLFMRGMQTTNVILILVAIVIGAIISAYPARKVQMTAMPQMVAIFNGMGGATVALVSVSEFTGADHTLSRGVVISIVLGTIIGSISFAGSIIAFMKLQELMSGRSIVYPAQQIVNGLVFLGITALSVAVVVQMQGNTSTAMLLGVFGLSLLIGALVVLPIGGADMPVVIAVLNSLTGVAAAITGFQLDNQALIVAGALVGASGSFLTVLMARAMNRSVTNVLFGAFGAVQGGAAGGAGDAAEARPIKSISAEDASIPLAYAQRVIIVPGYGLAVAQAQHTVRELAEVLAERGVDVRYAIHPVAGRMPGHMNVLLAEANVPYDELFEMDDINDDFARTDVALVIGANDVTNPAARTDTTSPIYGMPILNVDAAQTIIVLKRGMAAGFAGIENELFHDPKTSMLFGDAKESITRLITSVKDA